MNTYLTQDLISRLREWRDRPNCRISDIAASIDVSSRTVSTWLNSKPDIIEIKPLHYAKLIKALGLEESWQTPSIGVAILGTSAIRRTDGKLVSRIEQENIDRALRGADPELRTPQQRLEELEMKLMEILTEMSRINRVLSKDPVELQLQFPLECD